MKGTNDERFLFLEAGVPVGYDYRCQQCGEEWVLFTKRFVLGPTLWGATKYTCFNCQTFLSIAGSVDRNSWSVWLRGHEELVARNLTLSELAAAIAARIGKSNGVTPVPLQFTSVSCPSCSETMSAVPFGQHLMKCPKCGEFSGEFDGTCISFYE